MAPSEGWAMIGEYGGVHGEGQSEEERAPMPNKEVVRTSSRRSRASEKSLWLGAEVPDPNRLSRKVAPSGSELVVPGTLLRIRELAGTVKMSVEGDAAPRQGSEGLTGQSEHARVVSSAEPFFGHRGC